MQFEYNPAGELLRLQGYGQEVTRFIRNARGQVIQRTDPGGISYGLV
ncbi:RHS repeat protein, partial [Salmonella enterica subsp. salamae]|nr:RHS repeat protein [Salmonella enterica subsp. salamae]